MSRNKTESLLSWTAYSVSRREKQPLLHFITGALEMRGCRVVQASDPAYAPFYIVYETPGGERHGLLAYAFFANAKPIKNRPPDEHRFQIKYGGDLKTSLNVALDPTGVVTTIFLGIDLELGLFVAADPKLNNPSPMSRSMEFKKEHADEILATGWALWERDRRPPKAKDRPAFDMADLRTEALVGGTQANLLHLITLERIAQGLDPGERHLAGEQLFREIIAAKVAPGPHELLAELGIGDAALLDLIQGAPRLKMAVRGWVAEHHLETHLRTVPGVTECERLTQEGRPDISLRWKGRGPILIECKNTLRARYATGEPKLDFQRTRAAKGDPCSRYYRPEDFPILAACLHPVKEDWIFTFALTRDLPPHATCEGRIKNMLAVAEPQFVSSAASILDSHVASLPA